MAILSKDLKSWNRFLEEISEFLSVVRKRNKLLKESSDKKSEVSRKEIHYNEMIESVENFLKNHADNFEHADAIRKGEEFIAALKDELFCIKRKEESFLQKYAEAAKLTNFIDEKITYFSETMEEFIGIRLEEEDYSKEKLYEMVVAIFIAHFNDGETDEFSFFNSVKEFHKLLETSEDPILIELLEYDKNNITTHNALHDFLYSILN